MHVRCVLNFLLESMLIFVSILFFLIFVNDVVNSKNVLRIESFLDVLHKFKTNWCHNSFHESLSNLTNSVMMRQTSTLLKYLISAFIFNFFINMYDLIIWNICERVVETKVDVNSCSSLIKLSYSERYKKSIFCNSMRFTCDKASFLHIGNQWAYFTPWAGSLEGLSNEVVKKNEVSDVGNDESQEISFDAISGTSTQTTKLGDKFVDFSFLEFNFSLCTFIYNSTRWDLIHIKSLNLSKSEHFNFIYEFCHFRSSFFL